MIEKPFKMTTEEFAERCENNEGLCTTCGDPAFPIEPDACEYPCESCGDDTVYGIEELLLKGLIDFID